ncbi:MAG: hypothetical protein ACRDJ4_05575 [Actinomycetota bacterium]
MEAGLEHLSWAGGTLRYVDLLLVVVDPSRAAAATASRTIALAAQLGIPQVGLVANRVEDAAEVEAVAHTLGAELLASVPEDDALREADRRGVCVLDSAPEAEGVRVLEGLAAVLEQRFGGAAGEVAR